VTPKRLRVLPVTIRENPPSINRIDPCERIKMSTVVSNLARASVAAREWPTFNDPIVLPSAEEMAADFARWLDALRHELPRRRSQSSLPQRQQPPSLWRRSAQGNPYEVVAGVLIVIVTLRGGYGYVLKSQETGAVVFSESTFQRPADAQRYAVRRAKGGVL
jgi:hypothetical protein